MNYYVNKETGEIIVVLETPVDYRKFVLYRESRMNRRLKTKQTYDSLAATYALLEDGIQVQLNINNEEELLYLKELDNGALALIKKKELAEKWECLNNFLQNHQPV